MVPVAAGSPLNRGTNRVLELAEVQTPVGRVEAETEPVRKLFVPVRGEVHKTRFSVDEGAVETVALFAESQRGPGRSRFGKIAACTAAQRPGCVLGVRVLSATPVEVARNLVAPPVPLGPVGRQSPGRAKVAVAGQPLQTSRAQPRLRTLRSLLSGCLY